MDGVRAIAVLIVLFTHSNFSWAIGGHYGVDVFFALSGFLITSTLLSEYRRQGRINLRAFYILRAVRLLPALICVVAACCLIESVLGPFDSGPSIWSRSLWSLTYISNWAWAFGRDPQILGALTITWSLSIEEQFYVIWPTVLLTLLRHKINRRWIGALCLFAAVASGVLQWRLNDRHCYWPRVYAGSDVRGGVIFLGCAAALLWKEIDGALAKTRARAFIGGACFVLLLRMFHADRLGDLPGLASFNRLFVGMFTVGLVTTSFHGEGLVARFLRLKPLVYVGQISYGIYLWHGVLNRYFERYAPGSTVWLRITVGLGAAIVSYRVIEEPFLKLKELLILERAKRLYLGEGETGAGQIAIAVKD